jgi:RNase P subunit RPR2
MSLEEKKPVWSKVGEDVLSGMIEWRLQHPKATLQEIEDAVDERLGRLRQRMVEDAVQASSAAEWRELPKEERPRCAQCGTALVSRGKQKRRLQTQGGRSLELERSYGTCPTCGSGVFPPG